MNYVYLSGNSLRNRDWIYGVSQRLSPVLEESYIHDYEHWSSGKHCLGYGLIKNLITQMMTTL